MPDAADAITFCGNPLDRASSERSDPDRIAARLRDPDAELLPLWRGDPLVADDRLVMLRADARNRFPADAAIVFLGLRQNRAVFAIDASAAESPQTAPFAEIGVYTPMRAAAALLACGDLAVAGQARWLLDWGRRHRHCARCGAATEIRDGGARRFCPQCDAEDFPRSNPVAIVLAVHDDACLLGRSPHFPPGFLSALAGFIEACETPEECAVRELREEAGVTLTNVRYQFSQPWPFPSSLMMGFIADARDRELKLDEKEIVEARWIGRDEIGALLAGARESDVKLPPRFTIARRLIERWAEEPPA